MPSPFPGMDSYLEGSLWMSVHSQLTAEIARQLAPKLRPRYLALTTERFVWSTPDDVAVTTSGIYPDVGVATTRRDGAPHLLGPGFPLRLGAQREAAHFCPEVLGEAPGLEVIRQHDCDRIAHADPQSDQRTERHEVVLQQCSKRPFIDWNIDMRIGGDEAVAREMLGDRG